MLQARPTPQTMSHEARIGSLLPAIPTGWHKGRVSDLIASIESGVSVNGEGYPARDGEIGVLKVSSVSYGRFDPSANKSVTEADLLRVKGSPLKGHILMSRCNTPALVGASVFLEKNYPDHFLSDKLWQLIPKTTVHFSVRWLAYSLAFKPTRLRLSACATGSSLSMKNIVQDDLLALPIHIPPVREQEGIASILHAWDTAIARIDDLIKAKVRHRKVFQLQLLTGNRRFSEFVIARGTNPTYFGHRPADWDYPRVGQIATEVSERSRSENRYTVLSCSKHHGLVDSLEYFGKRVFSSDTSNYKVVRRGQFAYATNHIEEGSIGLLTTHEAGLISPIYTVFETNARKVYAPFLFRLFKTELYRHIFEVNTSSSVDRRGSLRWTQFATIHVPLPALGEQRRIVEVLDTVDREIDLLTRQADALTRQKKAIMQKLLTGQIRVKV